eukprot:scaffold10338_cov103-Alexandrium_tamarense.AAC.2
MHSNIYWDSEAVKTLTVAKDKRQRQASKTSVKDKRQRQASKTRCYSLSWSFHLQTTIPLWDAQLASFLVHLDLRTLLSILSPIP